MLSIGPYNIRNRVILAPMAGLTDRPFRKLAWEFGVGHVVSEMVSARADLWNSAKSIQRRANDEGITPRAIQIAGGDPQSIADSARRTLDIGADIVDLNFGCPAKKVRKQHAGSYLLRDPKLLETIARAAVSAVNIPVTAKIRTGWCPKNRNGVEVAKRLEDVGIAAIAVHGRTRECRFVGNAEYDTIAKIKLEVKIPIFANGDIYSLKQARQVVQKTGCDAVMIGRGALGQPWILGDIAKNKIVDHGINERLQVLIKHVLLMHEFYGFSGIKIARKHVGWYFNRIRSDFESRVDKGKSIWNGRMKAFNTLNDAKEQITYLNSLR